jgi:hypothetical protein
MLIPCAGYSYVEIANSVDLETITPAMRSSIQDGYVITSSSYYSTAYPYLAFDQSSGINTLLGSNGYVQLALPVARTVLSYKIKTSTTASYAPKDWTLKGSNDLSNWTTLNTQTNQTSWGSNEERTFSITSPLPYLYYKLDITGNNGASYIDLSEITLTGYKLKNIVSDIRSVLPADSMVVGYTETSGTVPTLIIDGSNPSGATPDWAYGIRVGQRGARNRRKKLGKKYFSGTASPSWDNPFASKEILMRGKWSFDAAGTLESQIPEDAANSYLSINTSGKVMLTETTGVMVAGVQKTSGYLDVVAEMTDEEAS